MVLLLNLNIIEIKKNNNCSTIIIKQKKDLKKIELSKKNRVINFEKETFSNEEQMNILMHKLYERIRNNAELSCCMKSVAGFLMSTDEELGLMILFSYDYLYLSHICISEFLEKGKISEYNIQNLKKIIHK